MKDSKKIIKKPDGFIYFIAYHLVKPFLRIKCKASYDKSGLKGLKGPALVLCPHVSNIDFLLVAVALYPVRPTFVISEHFLARPKLRWILTKMHVIPKKMFCPDIKTIMNILRAKDSGNVTVLFPEGRLPAMGRSLQITDGTADLVKRMGVDVYTVTENGAYKTFPKWGKSGFRPGRIEVTTSKLFDARSISSMTPEEIERAIEKALFHDEDALFEDVYYKCKSPALGLDGILYKCPVCRSEFTMTSGAWDITCSACGFRSELDNYYRLHGGPFEKINDWYFWQQSEIDTSLPLKSSTILAAADEKGNLDRDAGSGVIQMDRETISYEGTCFGQPFSFSEKVSDIKALPVSVGDHFDLYHKKKMYNFRLIPDPRAVIKWSMYMDKVTAEKQKNHDGI